MPDVVVVVKVQKATLRVEVTRGCWREDPAGGLVDEEVHGPRPGDRGYQDVDSGLPGYSLPVP